MSNPPSGYNTPKTNWQSADVVLPTDLNRIEGNINAIETGSRTIDPAQSPSGNSGSLRQWLDWFPNMIKKITGKTNWYDTPDTTLATANAKMHATTGHKHSGTTGDGPKIPVANVDFSGMTGFRELVLFGTTSQTAIANGTITRDQSDSSSSLTWHSFGPTGSGCSVILAGLDSVPSDAKAVLFDLYANRALEATSVTYAYVYVRKYGASEYAELNSGHGRPHLPVIVKCDSTRRFEFYYYLVNWGGNSIKVSLTGYVR